MEENGYEIIIVVCFEVFLCGWCFALFFALEFVLLFWGFFNRITRV